MDCGDCHGTKGNQIGCVKKEHRQQRTCTLYRQFPKQSDTCTLLQASQQKIPGSKQLIMEITKHGLESPPNVYANTSLSPSKLKKDI